jgi:hypothetical protein
MKAGEKRRRGVDLHWQTTSIAKSRVHSVARLVSATAHLQKQSGEALNAVLAIISRSRLSPNHVRKESPVMKTIVAIWVLSLAVFAYGQSSKPVTLRSILLDQLHTTHNHKDWFVPINVAVEGMTADQAN